MKAHPGVRIILSTSHIDQSTRHGEVIEVGNAGGDPPYPIQHIPQRWSSPGLVTCGSGRFA